MVRPSPSRLLPPPEECPLEECLQFLSGAWTTKILWFLREGSRRFGDLRRDLNGVSAKVLTTRLRELEERGVVIRTVMHTSPPTVEYALTVLGTKFQPVLAAIVEVGKELQRKEPKELKEDIPSPPRMEARL